jgi:hypothetical protein
MKPPISRKQTSPGANKLRRFQPAFIHFQESGRGRSAFPIEVGWAVPVEVAAGCWEVRLGSSLIRPHSSWLGKHGAWDGTFEVLHGISLQMLLENGIEATEVCDMIGRLGQHHQLVCNSCRLRPDIYRRLLAVSRSGDTKHDHEISLHDSESLFDMQCNALRIPSDRLEAELQRLPWPLPTHAAAENAYEEAWLYCTVEALGRWFADPNPGTQSAPAEQTAFENRIRVAEGSVFRKAPTGQKMTGNGPAA